MKLTVKLEHVAFIFIYASRSSIFGGANSCRLIECNQTERALTHRSLNVHARINKAKRAPHVDHYGTSQILARPCTIQLWVQAVLPRQRSLGNRAYAALDTTRFRAHRAADCV